MGRAAPMYSISQQIIVVCRVAKVYLGKLKNFNSLGMGRHNFDSSFKCQLQLTDQTYFIKPV